MSTNNAIHVRVGTYETTVGYLSNVDDENCENVTEYLSSADSIYDLAQAIQRIRSENGPSIEYTVVDVYI